MARKLLTLLVIMSLVVAVMALSSFASSSAKLTQAHRYGFSDQSSSTFSRGSTTTSLGAHTADGGSPGYIIGRTMRDDPAHLSPGRFVDWNVNPQIHFVFPGQLLAGHNDAGIARWIEYTMFDPTTSPLGVWLTPVWIQPNPISEGGWYPNLAVDETGHALPVGEQFLPAAPIRHSTIFWDMAGPGNYGSFVPDALPQALSIDPEEFMRYPRIEYQEYGGQYIVHVITDEDQSSDAACDNDAMTYWRKVVDQAGPTGTWTTMVFDDSTWTNHYDVAAANDGSGNVAIVWIHWPGFCDNAGGENFGHIRMLESSNGGETWGAEVILTDTTQDNNAYYPWVDVDAHYDSEGYLHVVWNTSLGGSIDPARLYHWSRRVVGPDEGGTTSLVSIADFNGLAPMCGRGSYNVGNTGKPTIAECNGKLYVSWMQYGSYELGDTTDCVDAALTHDFGVRYNADQFMSVASDLDGLLWDAPRNLTNSKTPGCDGTDENNCDHDAYGNMSRFGMRTAAFGDTYWGAVPEAFLVRDAIDPDWPDTSWYIDYWFLNDLMAEPARYLNDQEAAIWTYSPIKWFRLPCVDPIIEPRINISQDEYLHPNYWVQNGETETINLLIENIGNAELDVSLISANVTQGTGWLELLTTSMTIPPASNDIAVMEIDATGYAAGTTTAIAAQIIISSNDADGDLIWNINTVIADTVVVPTWDTVSTTLPTSLTVSTHGNAGFSGVGQANLDWVAAGDCDATQTVYLYDLCPVIFQAVDNYSWQPFWDGNSQGIGPWNFQSVIEGLEATHEVTDDYELASTGTFVTSDSAIGCTKYWIAPAAGVSYILERWDIYSYDGASHTGVAVGEWIDWDAPTGGNGNEGGYVDATGAVDYVFQKGTLNPAADPPPCINEDLRLGASGLLGYYTTTEYAADNNVNHSELYGGFVLQDGDVFQTGTDQFIVDSAWAWINRTGFDANNSADADQQVWLNYGAFDIIPDDTLTIWTVHVSIYDGDEDDLAAAIAEAKTWYDTHRPDFYQTGCCGTIPDESGKYPELYSGNANCSEDGKRTLSDVSRLIDHLYISKAALCCYAAGNTNGSLDWNETTQEYECKITLSDVSRLIDALYISKALVAPCESICERD